MRVEAREKNGMGGAGITERVLSQQGGHKVEEQEPDRERDEEKETWE